MSQAVAQALAPTQHRLDIRVLAVFNLFRLAAIFQGIARRAQDGTAASADARETGQRARATAETAWRRASRFSGV